MSVPETQDIDKTESKLTSKYIETGICKKESEIMMTKDSDVNNTADFEITFNDAAKEVRYEMINTNFNLTNDKIN